MRSRNLLVITALIAGPAGCVVFRQPVGYAPDSAAAGTAVTGVSGQSAPNESAGAPTAAFALPTAPSAEAAQVPQPPAGRQFHLGAASQALVAEAHRQAGGGDPQLAITTLERAVRIEPDNPLLWTELGALHQSAGHYEQAGGMGRKALQLATGDPHAQSLAWRLIAESLRARGRNGEAAEAEARAEELAAR